MTQPFREKRAHYRHRVLAGAEIQNNWKGTRCTVRDVSVMGANLVVSPAIRLQQYLKLRISKWSVCVDAEVVWRDADRVGVKFVETPDRLKAVVRKIEGLR
jgi:hypothetical protein